MEAGRWPDGSVPVNNRVREPVDQLRVRLFGDPTVEIGDTPVRFASRAAASLFAYLVVGGPRRVARSLLAGVFWPDLPEARARRRLSQALWQITSALEPADGVVHADRDAVEIVPDDLDMWVDIWELDRLLGELSSTEGADHLSRLREAAGLMVGELCAGYYDDWTFAPRERYRERYGHLLNELVRAHKARSDLDEALATAREVIGLQPLNEEPHREVMRLLHLLGRTAEAVDHHDGLQEMLAREVGADPEPETRALLGRLLAAADTEPEPVRTTTPPADDGRVPLVGRDRERVQLRHALDEAMAANGGLALVEGEPGIGKTRLLDDLRESADWRGFDVVTISCRSVGGPFASLIPALEEALPRLRALQLAEAVEAIWLEEVAEIVPRLRRWLPHLGTPESLGPAENRSRRTEAVVQVLAGCAAIRPLLVVVDDLHDADAETLAVLSGLARVSSGAALVVAAGYRPLEARDRPETWRALVDIEPRVRHRVTLDALDRPALATLAFEAGFEVSSDVLTAIHRETGGNPLFALETLRAVGEGQPDPDVPVASNVYDVISRRLALTAPSERATMDAVAVLGRPAGLDEILLLSGHATVGGLSADLEALTRRSLLAEEDEDFTLPHEQVRRVVYQEIEPARRQDMHAVAARSLGLSSPVSSAELAWHSEAGALPELAARHHAEAATTAVEATAYGLAADHFASALRLGWLDHLTPAVAFGFLEQYETTCEVIGDADTRADIITRLSEVAFDEDTRRVADLRGIAQLSAAGRLEEAAGAADRLIAHLDTEPDRRSPDDGGLDGHDTIAAAVLARSTVHLEAGDPTSSLTLLDSLVGRQLSAPLARSVAIDRARALQMTQRHAEALDAWAAVIANRAELDPLTELDALGMAGVAAAETGDVEVAMSRFSGALERARRVGHQFAIARNLLNRASLRQHHDPGAALDDYDEAGRIFGAIGSRRGEAFVAANLAGLRQTLFGVDAVADLSWRSALTAFDEMGNRGEVAHCQLTAGRSARAEGDLDAAAAHLAGALDNATSAKNHFTRLQVLAEMARVDLDSGRLGTARSRIDQAIEVAEGVGASQHLPALLAVAAAISLAAGDAPAAVITARRATALVDDFTYSPHLPWWQLARALEASDDPDAATALEHAWSCIEHLCRNLDPDDRKRAVETNPELAAVRLAWEAEQPLVETVDLPAVDAPTGRPLEPADLVTVMWTVRHRDDPMDPAAARRVRILRLTGEAAEQGAAPSIDHLAEALATSRSSVRRSLATLRREGHDVMTRGSRR